MWNNLAAFFSKSQFTRLDLLVNDLIFLVAGLFFTEICKFIKWLFSKLIKRANPLTNSLRKWIIDKTIRPRRWIRIKLNKANWNDVELLEEKQDAGVQLSKLEQKTLEKFQNATGRLVLVRSPKNKQYMDKELRDRLEKMSSQTILEHMPDLHMNPDFTHIKPK